MSKKTLTDVDHPSFFGRPILAPGRGLTLTSQVREILLEEILSGHWKVGERLPSVAALARQSGLSRWPIQEAFELLRKQGYLRQSERSGTFLETMAPEGRKPLGQLGVAMPVAENQKSWLTTPYSEYRLARVMAVAESRQYTVELKYLRIEDDWTEVDRVGKFFGSEVMGVLSLYAFPHPASSELGADRHPFVYLGGNSHMCLPAVAGDTTNGFYRLTRKLIGMGHRNIICFCDPSDTEWETQCHLLGHSMAMREAGFTVNQKAWERSLKIAEGDLSAVRAYLEEFGDATALICMWGGMAIPIIEVATMMGIRVPDDLSVTAHGACKLASRSDMTVTYLEYDVDTLIHTCLDLLIEQKQTRRIDKTHVLGNPRIHVGSSVAPPPSAPADGKRVFARG